MTVIAIVFVVWLALSVVTVLTFGAVCRHARRSDRLVPASRPEARRLPSNVLTMPRRVEHHARRRATV